MITDFFYNVKFFFYTLFFSLSPAQADFIIVLCALAVMPTLSLLANTAFGRNTFKKIYGDIEGPELRKFLILALAFGLAIAAYWSLRAVKDGYFNQMVGVDFVPKVKLLTVVFFSAIMFVFSSIVDRFEKHRLFLVVCSFYLLIFSAIALLDWLDLPALEYFPFNIIPGRAIGWLYYLFVESLGGILLGSVFWAFAASTTTIKLATKGFPIIFIGGQIGGILGTTFVKRFVHQLGHPLTILCGTVPLILLPLLIEYFIKTTPANLMLCDKGIATQDAAAAKKPKIGALAGLKLIAAQPYLMGIMVVSTIYEVVGTIIDFQFKKTAAGVYSKEFLTSYLASQGQALTILSLIFALIGTSFVVRTLGVRISLLGFPLIVIACVFAIFLKPTLTVFFVAMVSIKAFSYTLNSPVKEMLYLPTSTEVKYKAKGFIDGLGCKTSKAGGSAITEIIRKYSSGSNLALLNIGTMVSFGIIGFWVIVAFNLGATYHNLVNKKQIIE